MNFHTLGFFPTTGLTAILLSLAFSRAEEPARQDILSSFRPVDGWHGVADVSAVPGKTELNASGEGGIAVNGTGKAPYLITREEYGDVRVELEFMIPAGSNAGIYLMGRYEVQILDSFGKKKPGSGDMGGIYERWDVTRPQDRRGFDGIPPRENAAKPPGEWQTFEINFRAPRFDPAGRKLHDATFEKVVVNGVTVQENAGATGPTHSSPLTGEAATGPIAIQGDHGPIAVRRFWVTALPAEDSARITELDAYWAEVSRTVHEGDFEAYRKTYHPDGVLVSGSKKFSQPIAKALARWEHEFVDTKAGKMKAGVSFRFSQRFGDDTTAHESGIFLYTSQLPGESPKNEYIHFEDLLVKRPEGWKSLMEYQKSAATREEWDALVPAPAN